MKILVTGAKGFVGKNLVESLKAIREGKDRRYPQLFLEDIFEYDRDSTTEELADYCAKADFVFHLAGVNRPQKTAAFYDGNLDLSTRLLELLEEKKNPASVMLSSSVQASLVGCYAASDYGKSKRLAEEAFFRFAETCGNKVLVYRFPNLFGKWCAPNYNSVIATFCYNIAHDLAITVSDPERELTFSYIDDVVEELLLSLTGQEHRCAYEGLRVIDKHDGKYAYVPTSYNVRLGEVVSLLHQFRQQPATLFIPEISENSFAKKLYSTYLSYLPKEKMVIDLFSKCDERGSFTEVLKTFSGGQISVNISKPGVTKGEHWHHSKWEFFVVIKGEALIQERRLHSEEIIEFRVSGARLQAVHMLPGYTHNIRNCSQSEELITLVWANETFDERNPDTFYAKVGKE